MGVDLFGVAPVARFEGAQRKGSHWIICLRRHRHRLRAKIPDAIVETAGHYDEPGKTLAPYMWYGYVTLNWDSPPRQDVW